ncbi:MAG: MotA/TolQ/ExbB proton channel family protein [Wenzhouxiangellaceae bacterium]|nr:MotA/TolQ/ExbB proton channel family protein [Wenzhouxiangellaceae bacterium]
MKIRSMPLFALLSLLLAALFTSAWSQQEPQPEDSMEPTVEAGSSAAVPAPQAQQPSLEQAYQREFAFLQSQKRDLERRLASLRQSIEQEKSTIEREIRALEGDVVKTRGQADRLDDMVFESERAVELARENSDLLGATFTQADFTLDQAWSSDLGDQAPGADDVAGLFDAALGFLTDGHQVRRSAGAFFLADGTRVDGEILKVGNVAAYGLSEQGSGALAPAGDGELKIWDAQTAEPARALAAGQKPDSLPIFLFESLNAEVEKKVGKGVMETVSSGGAIGWIIFFLGIVGIVLVVLRVIFLRRAGSSTGRVLDAVSGHVRRGDRDAALEVLSKRKSSTARVLAATIRNLNRDREHVEDIVSESILHENSHLNRFGSMIIVIAAVSPLLGLLGTVTGMIATFDVITEFGTGDPKLLSGGISIALVTTELGLIVAIPLLLFGNLLSGWAEGIKDSMEKAALRVINQYGQNRAAEAGGAA